MIISPRKNGRVLPPNSFVARKIDGDNPVARSLASLVRVYFFDDARLHWLILASCLVLFASIWLIVSPGVVYSREMTWDLLFNLDGAWRLYTGQVLHVDFHHPMGALPFAITALGFEIVGIKPIAFVVGECMTAAAFGVLALVAVKDRLPTFPGFLFVSTCILLALVPVTIGDDPSQLTFAMSYNRIGWISVSILCFLLFIEPRERHDPVWTDLITSFILMIGLLYLKITYFGVAVAAISLALLTSRHVRRYWPGWCGVLFAVVLIAFVPINDAYRADIISAFASGRAHTHPFSLIRQFALDGVEQIWVLAQIIVLVYLASQRYAALADVVFGCFIWICGFVLLSQNAQATSIPLYVVLALLLYVRLGNWLRLATARPLMLISCLMTCVLLPLLPPLFSNGLTLALYNYKAKQSARAFVVTETNLQGLEVPADDDNVFDEVAADRYMRDSFSRIRALPRLFELTQQEYLKTILGLADWLRERDAASARVVIIDQVNPLPFVLGATAPRGGNLWAGDLAWQPPEQEFQDADYVAIPRFPTQRAFMVEGLKAYGAYLSTRFARRWETPYWTILERRNAS
jgi:hypothetical protein